MLRILFQAGFTLRTEVVSGQHSTAIRVSNLEKRKAALSSLSAALGCTFGLAWTNCHIAPQTTRL